MSGWNERAQFAPVLVVHVVALLVASFQCSLPCSIGVALGSQLPGVQLPIGTWRLHPELPSQSLLWVGTLVVLFSRDLLKIVLWKSPVWQPVQFVHIIFTYFFYLVRFTGVLLLGSLLFHGLALGFGFKRHSNPVTDFYADLRTRAFRVAVLLRFAVIEKQLLLFFRGELNHLCWTMGCAVVGGGRLVDLFDDRFVNSVPALGPRGGET